jgi:predicted transcriptional regulator YheO
VINTMIGNAVAGCEGRPFDRDHKIALLRELDQKGVFLARGALRQVAAQLGIALPTVYKYVHLARRSRGSSKHKDRS